MAKRGHAWQSGACLVKGACMVKGDMCGVAGGMHGKGQHVWQGGMGGMGACMAKEVCVPGVCMVEGMHGRGDVHGRGGCAPAEGCAWQERQPLQQTVCMLLECILVLSCLPNQLALHVT